MIIVYSKIGVCQEKEEYCMETKLTKLLGIKYPIIQGAMAWVSDAHLVSAVANTGATGVIATGGRDAQWVRNEIRKAKELTSKPFGVNLLLSENDVLLKKKIVIEEGVNFVTTGAGNPIPHIEELQLAKIKVIPVVPNLKLAKRVEKAGADAIVIEGLEAGGHIGTLTTMALMTQVIPEIQIPVIVAGGIVERRGFLAALLMGASGVQMGTRFYASKECSANEKAKLAIVRATDIDTETTGRRGREVRGIKNKMTNKYHELINSGASEEEIKKLVVGSSKVAPIDGDVEWGFVQAGQSLSQIKSILSCEEIVHNLIGGSEEQFNQICQLIK